MRSYANNHNLLVLFKFHNLICTVMQISIICLFDSNFTICTGGYFSLNIFISNSERICEVAELYSCGCNWYFLLKVHPSPLSPSLFRQPHQRNSLFTLNILFSVSSQSAQKRKACQALSQRRKQMLRHWNIAGRELACGVETTSPLKYRR